MEIHIGEKYYWSFWICIFREVIFGLSLGTHTEDKSYYEVCGYASSQKSDLEFHMSIHLRETSALWSLWISIFTEIIWFIYSQWLHFLEERNISLCNACQISEQFIMAMWNYQAHFQHLFFFLKRKYRKKFKYKN